MFMYWQHLLAHLCHNDAMWDNNFPLNEDLARTHSLCQYSIWSCPIECSEEITSTSPVQPLVESWWWFRAQLLHCTPSTLFLQSHWPVSWPHDVFWDQIESQSHSGKNRPYSSRCSQQKEIQKLQPAVSGWHTYGITTCIFMCYKPQEILGKQMLFCIWFSFISIYIIIVIQMLILA